MVIRQTNRPARLRRWVSRALPLAALALVAFGAGVAVQRTGLIGRTRLLLRQVPARLGIGEPLPEVPVVSIDMRLRGYLRIVGERQEALRRGILLASGADYVPATLTVGGRAMRVRMRLKGGGRDHWRGDKWSFRVKVRDDEAFFGMRVFSLQHPRTRNFDLEWLHHSHQRREGVLALRYLLVRLVLNGEDKGIYAAEEHFSQELLESQGRQPGLVVQFEEAGHWRRVAVDPDGWLKVMGGKEDWAYNITCADQMPVVAARRAKAAASPPIATQRDAAVQLLRSLIEGRIPPSRVFKVEKLGRYLAVAEMWSASHDALWSNLRLYYDPIEARFEPIAFDAESAGAAADITLLRVPWVQRALRDPAVARAFVANLVRMSREEYLRELKDALAEDWERHNAILDLEWPGRRTPGWRVFEAKQRYVRQLLALSNIVRASAVPSPAGAAGTLEVRVGSVVQLPVEVVGFRLPNGDVVSPRPGDAEAVVLPARPPGGPIEYQAFPVAVPEGQGSSLHALCRVIGTSGAIAEQVRLLAFEMPAAGPRPRAPSMEDALGAHPFLERADGPASLRARRGDWTVAGDLVLPDKASLTVPKGTTLRFATGAALVCTGKLDVAGTRKNPVRLLPASESWGGVLVLDAPASEWQHAEVVGAAGIDRKGWVVPGGVTFCRSPARLERCRFGSSAAPAALHVRHARVECRGCLFEQCGGDGLGADYAVGVLEDCAFEQIDGCAIQARGGDLRAHRVTARRVGGHALRVEREGRVVASFLDVADARVAVSSTDLATVKISRSSVRKALVGLAAYVRHKEYGPAAIEARKIDFEDVRDTVVVQHGSHVTVDGKMTRAGAVDVAALDGPGQVPE